jgi:predicted acylesterase/phospholipase RssA
MIALYSLLLSIFCYNFIIVNGFNSLLPWRTDNTKTSCLYFTGAGVYFWWQAGAAKYLREHFEVDNCPIIGASAGSLTSTLLLLDVDFDYAAAVAKEIAISNRLYDRKIGLAGIFGGILRNWFETVLPSDYNKEKTKLLKVALTPLSSSPKLVYNFETRNDLIEACLASCHVPVFLDGKLFTVYRNEPVFDGSFW